MPDKTLNKTFNAETLDDNNTKIVVHRQGEETRNIIVFSLSKATFNHFKKSRNSYFKETTVDSSASNYTIED